MTKLQSERDEARLERDEHMAGEGRLQQRLVDAVRIMNRMASTPTAAPAPGPTPAATAAHTHESSVRVRGSVAVQAFRLCTGLRDFRDLVKLVDSKAKPMRRRIALLARYKCTLDGEQAEDIGVEAGQMFEGELFDQDSWDSQVENIRLVAPTTMVLLIEVCLVRAGEAAGSELDLDAIMSAAASEAVSLFSFSRKYCLGANAVQQRREGIHAVWKD